MDWVGLKCNLSASTAWVEADWAGVYEATWIGPEWIGLDRPNPPHSGRIIRSLQSIPFPVQHFVQSAAETVVTPAAAAVHSSPIHCSSSSSHSSSIHTNPLQSNPSCLVHASPIHSSSRNSNVFQSFARSSRSHCNPVHFTPVATLRPNHPQPIDMLGSAAPNIWRSFYMLGSGDINMSVIVRSVRFIRS